MTKHLYWAETIKTETNATDNKKYTLEQINWLYGYEYPKQHLKKELAVKDCEKACKDFNNKFNTAYPWESICDVMDAEYEYDQFTKEWTIVD